MRAIIHLLCIIALATSNWNIYANAEKYSLDDYKLPEDIKPINYELKLIPYLEDAPYPKNFTYEGEVGITFKVVKPTDLIRMHSDELTIFNETVTVVNVATNENQIVVLVNHTEPDDDRFFLDIYLDQDLEEDSTYIVKFNFEGTLNDKLSGFYRSGYMENGTQKWMYVTDFEPTDARKAFPCFDEPGMKATFDVSIARMQNWTVLANMPVLNETEVQTPGLEELTWVNFQRTVKMSTYLVAFSVSQYESVTSTSDARFKVWARPDLVETGKYASKVGPTVLKCMEKYTGIKYVLPKMDQIAVPKFGPGAMENWGLVTYRESALLYSENRRTINKQGTASVIAHELSHQWFGNLVSPKWWSNLWLNEGFATFLANYIGSCVEPKMAFMEQFLTSPFARALDADDSPNAHPLVATVSSPRSIRAIFDSFSYSKGGSVIRMMLNIMGEQNFWKGINAYLEEMKFSNADQNDLWRGLSTAVPEGLLPENVQFKDIMDTWALQAGYPVVTVTRDYDKNTVSFTQKRFFTAPPKEGHNEIYWVPLTMVVQDAPKENSSIITWLHNKTITIDMPSSDKWLLVNNQKNGYYRVNYDKENWKKLSEVINGTDKINTLSVNNRVQLLMDSLAMAKAKELDYETALGMTKYLNFETELTPWNAAAGFMSHIYYRVANYEPVFLLFEKYFTSKMDHLYNIVNGFKYSEKDEHTIRLLRVQTLQWLCAMGHETCNKDGHALYKEWQSGNASIHPDILSIVLRAGMRVGGEDEYENLLESYRKMSNLEYEILGALASSTDKKVLNRLLSDSISEDSVFKPEHVYKILLAVKNNPVGINVALDFVIEHFFHATAKWDEIVFLRLSPLLSTNEQKQKITNFLESHNATLSEQARGAITLALTHLEHNMAWSAEHNDIFTKFFESETAGGDQGGMSTVTIVSIAVVSVIILAIGAFLFKRFL